LEKTIRPVKWTSRAVNDLEKNFRFNINIYGSEKAIEIATKIRKHTEILENSDFKGIGSIDEDFLHLKFEYRKIIYKHCKITYRIGNEYIYINRIFDPRQNPIKNK
jgi:plasmid stabilization system protein ParE